MEASNFLDAAGGFVLKAPGVAQLVDYFWRLLKDDKDLRLLRSQNAAQLVRENNVTVDSTAIWTVPGADNAQQLFSTLLVVSDEASGKGRYLTSGRNPTAGGQGLPLPSAGSFVTITGNDQIRQFKLIAETGATLNVWYGLFQ